MNERLQKLYSKVLDESENMRWNIEDAEKFAELMAREFAKVADDGFASSNFGNGITGDQLLKHFGFIE